MGRMIKVEGFKAFQGVMRIKHPIFYGEVDPGDCDEFVSGDWLYKPDTGCWYCGGKSYPEEICDVWRIE